MVWWEALEDLAPTAAKVEPWVDVYCHLSTAAEAEDVQRWILDHDQVADVEVYFPRRWFVVPAWFDERIAARMPA